MTPLDLSPRFDRAIAALTPGTRRVVVTESAVPVRKWTVGPRGASLLFESSSRGLRPFRYFYRVTGGQMEAYDLDLKERLVRPLRGRDLEGIAKSIGVIEDPVRIAASPASLRAFLQPLRGPLAWTGSNPYRLKVGDAAYELAFGKDGSLARVDLARAGKRIAWTTSPGRPVIVGNPANYRFVDRFVRRPLLPQGKPDDLRALDAALLAWRKLEGATVARSDGRALLFSFGRTGERWGKKGWDYRSSVLTVVDGSKGWRGKIAPPAVPGVVSKLLGERPDRLTIARVQGTYPFAEYLYPSGRVSTAAETGEGRILELTGGGVVVGMLVAKNGRTLSIESRPAAGGPLSRAAFRYGPPTSPLVAPRYEPLPD